MRLLTPILSLVLVSLTAAAARPPGAPFKLKGARVSREVEYTGDGGVVMASTRGNYLPAERAVKPRTAAGKAGAPRFPTIGGVADFLTHVSVVLDHATPTERRMARPILRRALDAVSSGSGTVTLERTSIKLVDAAGSATLATHENKLGGVSVTWPKTYASGPGSVTHELSGFDNLGRRYGATTHRRPIATPTEGR